MNLLRLNEIEPSPPAPGGQLPLFEKPPAGQADFVPQLLMEVEEEGAGIISRETFLASLVLHIGVIAFLVSNPGLIHFGSPEIVLPPPEERQVTMLYEPPPPPRPRPQLQAPPEPPPAPALPRAQGTLDSPLDRPQPLPGERLIEPAEPRPQPREQAEGRGNEEELAARAAPRGTMEAEQSPREPALGELSRTPLPRLEAPAPTEAQLRLPVIAAPSRGTEAILREMARQQAEGRGTQGGVSSFVPNPGDPNFSLPGPQILSDTMGVNFDPYLLRVYLSVQRNWYSVIPEIARLGRKGRVILQFRIMKNGSVQELAMMDGSGTSSMDSAAMSSIQLSNPFPPLPPEFPGNDIVLRFGYYYNMQPEYGR